MIAIIFFAIGVLVGIVYGHWLLWNSIKRQGYECYVDENNHYIIRLQIIDD